MTSPTPRQCQVLLEKLIQLAADCLSSIDRDVFIHQVLTVFLTEEGSNLARDYINNRGEVVRRVGERCKHGSGIKMYSWMESIVSGENPKVEIHELSLFLGLAETASLLLNVVDGVRKDTLQYMIVKARRKVVKILEKVFQDMQDPAVVL